MARTDAQDDFSIERYRRLADQLRGAWVREADSDDGLRERKKRRTRQDISDIATWMFCDRGFEHVSVSEIAAEAGVSEKTVYNYFPSKELLVFDQADETEAAIAAAMRERAPGTSPTDATVATIDVWSGRLVAIPHELRGMRLRFREMIAESPALVAFRRQMGDRFVDVIADALSDAAEIDPRDPEPRMAAMALASLYEIFYASDDRHLLDGLWGEELHQAVMEDVRRAARLLDTGLWSFNVVVQGVKTKRDLVDASKAARDAQKQIAETLRQARNAWRDALRDEIHARHETARRGRGRRPRG